MGGLSMFNQSLKRKEESMNTHTCNSICSFYLSLDFQFSGSSLFVFQKDKMFKVKVNIQFCKLVNVELIT